MRSGLFPALMVVYLTALGFLYAQTVMSPDQATFAYVGWRAAEGARFYIDVGEQNWPGAMWLHQAAILLFGREPWSWRVFEFLIAILGTFGLRALLPRPENKMQGYLLWLLYPALYTFAGLWFSGQRDIVGANLCMVGAAALAARFRGAGVWTLAVLALTLFVSTMLRPPYLLFGGLLVLGMLALRARLSLTWAQLGRDVGLTLLFFFGLLGGLLLYGRSTGALEEWWIQSVLFNLTAYRAPFNFKFVIWYLVVWGPLFPAAVVGFVSWWRSGERRFELLAILSMTATGLVSFVVMGKGFAYHLGGLHPMLGAGLVLGVCAGLRHLRTSTLPRRLLIVAMIGLAGLGLARRFTDLMDEPLKWALGLQTREQLLARQTIGQPANNFFAMAERVEAEVPEDGTVLSDTGLLLVNYLAGRPHPLRFITTGILELAAPPFEYAGAWQDEVVSSLEADPPDALLMHVNRDGTHNGLPVGKQTPYTDWIDRALAEDYVEVGRWLDVALLVPKTTTTSTSAE